LYEQGGFTSLRAFDERFRGTQFLSNWVQDLEMELRNAGLQNPVYLEHRIRYCEDFLSRFGEDDDLRHENMRRAVAESWADLGQRSRSDALFEQWLKDDPQWGWGWIGWADTYWFIKEADRDLPRAEALLKRGLDVPGVRDRNHIMERLLNLYDEQGRTTEAGALKQQLTTGPSATTTVERVGDRQLSLKTKLDFGEGGLPLDQLDQVLSQFRQTPPPLKARPNPNIDRNDPCPCGSGKKYKKCCGR
jgi:hypothetical protein